MESIAAVMVVTVALTAFMGALAYSELADEKREVDIDMHFLDALHVEDGRIVGNVTPHLTEIREKNNYSGIDLKIRLVGYTDDSRTFTSGNRSADDVRYFSGSMPIETDKGETVLASYEMEVFL